jgi:hypothetical protein
MKFTKTGIYGGTTEILANDHYVAIPKTLDFTGNADGIFKAGTPIGADGKAAVTTSNVSNAVGILLSDVTTDNPNGTIVIHGFIDTVKAQAHSGVTVDTATKSALPMVLFC